MSKKRRKEQDNPGKTVLAAGRFLQLVSENGWEYVERCRVTGVVAIVAVTDDGKLVLTEQYRRPVRSLLIEIPAGLAGDVPGEETEALATAARRELLEETGYEAAAMDYVTHGPSSAGLTTEIITFFVATGLRKTGPGGGDDSETIVVHEIPLATIDAWLAERANAGAMIDPKVHAALYLAGRIDRR